MKRRLRHAKMQNNNILWTDELCGCGCERYDFYLRDKIYEIFEDQILYQIERTLHEDLHTAIVSDNIKEIDHILCIATNKCSRFNPFCFESICDEYIEGIKVAAARDEKMILVLLHSYNEEMFMEWFDEIQAVAGKQCFKFLDEIKN